MDAIVAPILLLLFYSITHQYLLWEGNKYNYILLYSNIPVAVAYQIDIPSASVSDQYAQPVWSIRPISKLL
jgi:hypothetical protein